MVLEADTSAVFLADLQMVSGIPKVQQLWRDTTNAPAEYINKHIAKGLTVSVDQAMQESLWCFFTLQVQSAGFTGWLAPLWRVATCALLTLFSFFKVESCILGENQIKRVIGPGCPLFSLSLTITHPPVVGVIAR